MVSALTMLKHIIEILAAFIAIGLLIALKYLQIKDHTVFSNDKGPQTLFDSERKSHEHHPDRL
jgi:hypothetical protein